jgi:hypothetical protein
MNMARAFTAQCQNPIAAPSAPVQTAPDQSLLKTLQFITARIHELGPKPARVRGAFRFGLAALLLVALASGIRLYGALNDLWLDEILTVNLAGQITSPGHVFTRIHLENNHYLNTLWVYFLGPQANWLCYRLPSLAAGVGTVVLAGLICRPRSNTSALFAMLLVTSSYVMVLYSGEARGYALAVCFSFLAFYLLDCHLRSGRRWVGLFFALSVVLGFLAQLVCVSFYLAALAWSALRWFRSGLGHRQLLASALACHALPLACLTLLYFTDLRYLANLGGTASPSMLHSYGTALAWALGTPTEPGLQFAAAILAAAVLAAGTVLLWKAKSDWWFFFPAVVLVFPVFLALARGSLVLYVRYFIVAIAFLLLLGAVVLAALCRQGWPGKVLCLLLLLGYLLGNGWQIAKLFHYGRGQYREAIGFLSQHSTTPLVTIASDQDFRTSTMLQFYAPVAMAPKQGRYVPQDAWPPGGPEWIICQKESFEKPTPPVAALQDERTNRYDFVKTFPTAPLSGLHWFLYHNRSNATLN